MVRRIQRDARLGRRGPGIHDRRRGGKIAGTPAEFAAATIAWLRDEAGRRGGGRALARWVRRHCSLAVTAAYLPLTLRLMREGRGTPVRSPSVYAMECAARGLPRLPAKPGERDACP